MRSADAQRLERRNWANQILATIALPQGTDAVFVTQRAGTSVYVSTNARQAYVIRGNRLVPIPPPQPADLMSVEAVLPDDSLLAGVERQSGERLLMRWKGGQWLRVDPPVKWPKGVWVVAVSPNHRYALVSEADRFAERAWRLSLSTLRWERLPDGAHEWYEIGDDGAFVGARKGWRDNAPTLTYFYATSPVNLYAPYPWGSSMVPGFGVKAERISALGSARNYLVRGEGGAMYWVRPQLR